MEVEHRVRLLLLEHDLLAEVARDQVDVLQRVAYHDLLLLVYVDAVQEVRREVNWVLLLTLLVDECRDWNQLLEEALALDLKHLGAVPIKHQHVRVRSIDVDTLLPFVHKATFFRCYTRRLNLHDGKGCEMFVNLLHLLLILFKIFAAIVNIVFAVNERVALNDRLLFRDWHDVARFLENCLAVPFAVEPIIGHVDSRAVRP